ncbi:MAG: UDP-N-acetylmuramoyl-L-alanyl-D-glutamate--2,6-diaminopimelate ligase [Gemmatimonadaceae bacterium]
MSARVADIERVLADQGLLIKRTGIVPAEVSGIADDSRNVKQGDLFVAVRGWDKDGHDFLGAAGERGAALAIVEDASSTTLPSLVVREGRRAAAIAAATFYGQPARKLTMVGVTGTNGKTTSTSIMRHLFDDGQGSSASIGTLGVLVGSEGDVLPGGSGLTTPGPVELQRILRELVDRGVERIAMETSSHSLDQKRVEGLEFDVAVFTNLTRDHLDYHGTMEAYLEAKARLLDYLKPDGTAVINADVDAWKALRTTRKRLTFSIHAASDFRAQSVRFNPAGSEWTLVTPKGAAEVSLPLIGDVNVENAVAAAAAAFVLGQTPAEIAERLSGVPQVAGRLEIISRVPTVLRDYAHTPDALQRTLRTARAFTNGKLIVVFGCGGDRDKGKRPMMGEIAERDADYAIVTSDNPRTEDPDSIIDDIETGMRGNNHERITDRLAAIHRALELAEDHDIVMLAGKGHETYQIRGTKSYPFDEKEIVREMTESHA